ncbi:MAG: hypothetical protein KDE27_12465, partial [Planctomycetes bacterium]|nr:hypothetical protein [Planctomycetota bacterium]
IATPPPLPRRRHRKSAAGMLGILPTILVVIAVLMLLGTFSRREARLRGRNQATRADYVAERELSRPGGLEGRLDEFVAAAQRRVQTAMRRCEAPELRELRFADVAAPGDMPAYVHLVEGLAEAAAFSAGHAAKLERYGRPVFLAAVALLQSYDYDDPGDCRCAAHTTDLLAHLTGLSGLRLRWSGAEPAAGDTCGYRVYADAWRELAETFATTDADYERLLAAKGHGRG